jgi:hypothetical protein
MNSWVGRLEQKLQDKCDFEMGIEVFNSDGICIINVATSQVAPVYECISHIEKTGKLTADEHDRLCI